MTNQNQNQKHNDKQKRTQVRLVLMDIEGTTTSLSFVKETLFPYSAERLPQFLAENAHDFVVQECVTEALETAHRENLNFSKENIADLFMKWIGEDRKHPALKRLQGLIWREGYEEGHYKAHVYADVFSAWEQWQKEKKLTLAIYSSGSVEAQKLLFAHTEKGDITPYLSYYFDTAMGGKNETSSYEHIAAELKLRPEEILFLSDIEKELQAAEKAGMQVCQLVRPGTQASQHFATVSQFSEISL